ncbi:hypothetical protein RUM44_008002 [Polyplax serrata]|uniref:Uncharacterized protein n=1 Tax=Polyplax serrata TaxID=468196 RepID=A0ABR1B7J6_POLSC
MATPVDNTATIGLGKGDKARKEQKAGDLETVQKKNDANEILIPMAAVRSSGPLEKPTGRRRNSKYTHTGSDLTGDQTSGRTTILVLN